MSVALLAGCATGLGALPTPVTDRVSHRIYDGPLGLAAGVVVGVAVFVAAFAPAGVVSGPFPIAAGFAAGAMIAVVFREAVPSNHGRGYADTATATFVCEFADRVPRRAVLAAGSAPNSRGGDISSHVYVQWQ